MNTDTTPRKGILKLLLGALLSSFVVWR